MLRESEGVIDAAARHGCPILCVVKFPLVRGQYPLPLGRGCPIPAAGWHSERES